MKLNLKISLQHDYFFSSFNESNYIQIFILLKTQENYKLLKTIVYYFDE